MRLRFTSDIRTLAWAFLLFPAVMIAAYVRPGWAPYLLPLSLYVGFTSGVFAHNHNHCPTFVGRRANALFAAWISLFYGYPTFAWIPTHNLNHHKFLNRPGDATITWRYSKKNTWLVASTYFFVSAYWQKSLTDAFVRNARATRPRLYRQIVAQAATVVLGHAALVGVAVALHGAGRGLLVYACSFGASAAMGLWGMIFINYIQHVHCDPWSEHDHSRNFVSRAGNFLVFNAGYHTAHHEHPGAHWSALPALHAAIAAEIHPALNERSILWFCFRAYALGALDARLRTQQIGRAAYDPPAGSPAPPGAADAAT
jgi:fatty acid desaturase